MLANFACPHCQSMLQMDSIHAGGQVRCPACNQVFTLAALPPEAPQIPTATLAQHSQPRPPVVPLGGARPAPVPAEPSATGGKAVARSQSHAAQPRIPRGRPPAPAPRATSATDPAREETKAKVVLGGIVIAALGILALVGHFVMRYVSETDVTGITGVLQEQAEREKAAVRDQLAADAKAEAELRSQKEVERKRMRDLLSLNVCGGDDAVAGELLGALEQVQEEMLAAFNQGALPADVPGFMEKSLLKKMADNTTLRKWFGPRSPREFAHALFASLGNRQDATDLGQGQTPSLFTSGKYGAMGTGFYISEDGWLITNEHVVTGVQEVDVRTASGEIVKARVAKADRSVDLALLKTAATSSDWLLFSKGQAPLGSSVFTIGYPRPTVQGIEAKFTDGTLSSLKGLHDDPKNYQISVPVQPGNSGGALVHLQSGWAVGVVCAVLNGSGAQNVNYAVKSTVVRTFLESYPPVRTILDAPAPVALKDSGALIDKVKSATVLVLIPRS